MKFRKTIKQILKPQHLIQPHSEHNLENTISYV